MKAETASTLSSPAMVVQRQLLPYEDWVAVVEEVPCAEIQRPKICPPHSFQGGAEYRNCEDKSRQPFLITTTQGMEIRMNDCKM